MALEMNEIVVGAVAYLDAGLLNKDGRLKLPSYPTTRKGPFICFSVANGQSAWAPLTTKQRPDGKRLLINKGWKAGGSEKWLEEDAFLNDGACTYVGSHEAFIDASKDEPTFVNFPRPSISADGLQEIRAAVAARGGSCASLTGRSTSLTSFTGQSNATRLPAR